MSGKSYFEDDSYFVGSKSNYDKLPGGYRFLRRAMFWTGKVKRIRKYMSSGRVLDIGCAYGYLLHFMKDDYEVHGCDISPHAVKTCKRLMPDRKECFFTHDITNPLPFPPEHFDVIICQDVIEHIPDIMVPLRNIHAALKPGGIFFFRVPIKTRYKATEVLRMERDPTHVSVMPEQELEARVKAAGFTILERRHVWMGAIPLPRWIRFGSDVNMILQK